MGEDLQTVSAVTGVDHRDGRPSLARRFFDVLAKRLRWVLVCVCLLTLWSFLAGQWMLGELATHFRLQYAVVLLIGGVWLAGARRWRLLVPVVVCCSVNFACLVPWYLAPRTADASELDTSTDLRVLLANVLTTNEEHERVLELVEREDPDIVVLLELNERWLQALGNLRERYPTFVEEGRPDNFGIAVYSRVPMEELQVVYYGSAGVPSVRGAWGVGESKITFIATHPVPPVRPEYFAWRNEQLEALARIAGKEEACILVGDLNTTPWSTYYQEFEKRSGLRNARLGFGVLPTWPVGLGLLGIPLDHCLVSDGILVEDVRVGGETGGDHLPILVDLRLP